MNKHRQVLLFTAIIFCCNPLAADVPLAERNALVALYNSTDGANWKYSTNWTVGDPCTNGWYGVECDGENTSVLNLDSNQLMGSIPVELGSLSILSELDLGSNQLTGSIPVELGSLGNLQILDLYDNLLTGSIPAELGNLTYLQMLDLENNQLTGSIPVELGNLTYLQYLWLYGNQLTGSTPVELGRLSNLQILSLGSNQLTGSIPVELGSLSNLENLDLYGNLLTGSIPVELGYLPNLQILSLESNQLTGSIPVELGSLTNVYYLGLYDNQLTGSIPVELGSLGNLQILDLYDNQLTGSIPVELSDLSNLQILSLENNQLTGSIPVELGSLSNLESLSLNGNNLTGEVPAALSNLINVIDGQMDLGWNGLYTSNGALNTFLDTKSGLDWSATQTIAPDNVLAVPNGGESATVYWDAIEFTGETGRYLVGYSTSPGGPYLDGGATANKLNTSHFIDGLSPGTEYHFVATTETDAHARNSNKVISDPSAEDSAIASYQNEQAFFGTSSDMLTSPNPFIDTPFTFLQVNAGFDAVQDAILVTADANITNLDKLTLTSSNATWHDAADDGVFLGMSVWGDFTVELTIDSMDAATGHSIGLMVRVPTSDGLDAGGPGQDYVTLGVSGGITQIEWSSTDNAETTRAFENQNASIALNQPNGTDERGIHFRITRNGSMLSMFYKVGDAVEWIELDASPLQRTDIDTLELEVGIYQTSVLQATAVVDDFSVRSDQIFHSSFE